MKTPMRSRGIMVLRGQKFMQIGIHPFMQHALNLQNIKSLSTIQRNVFPHFLNAADIAIRTYTGSGKTFAFLLPLISKIMDLVDSHVRPDDTSNESVNSRIECGNAVALIITPTTELTMQILRTVRSILPENLGRLCYPLNGGANTRRQIERYKKTSPMILIGTPGRVADMVRLNILQLHKLPFLVLDDADELLRSLYHDDIDPILFHTGKKLECGRQTSIVSATLTQHCLNYAQGKKWLKRDGVEVLVDPLKSCINNRLHLSLHPKSIHFMVLTNSDEKYRKLQKCLTAVGAQQCIIFVNVQRNLQNMKKIISKGSRKVAILHGGLDALERKAALERFHTFKAQVLITNDLGARGIDFSNCSVVFNYELPSSAINYVHRAGRARDAGAVFTFYTTSQRFIIQKWEQELLTKFLDVQPDKREISVI